MLEEASLPTEVRAARELLRRAPDVLVAYAFGSRVEGRAHRESDLDMAVLLDWDALPARTMRDDRQIALMSELIGVSNINEIDLVVLNDAPPLLARHIVRNGLLLHAVSDEHTHALLRDVQLRAADLEPFILRLRKRLLEHFSV